MAAKKKATRKATKKGGAEKRKAPRLSSKKGNPETFANVSIRLRREWVERRMVEATRTTVIAVEGAEKFGVSTKTIYADMTVVWQEWEAESEGTSKERHRLWLDRTARETLHRALLHERQYPNPITGEMVVEPDPKFGPAARLIEVLTKLHGLNNVEVRGRMLHRSAGEETGGGATQADLDFLMKDLLGVGE